ncbi:DUF2000 family protein [Rhodoferax sp. U11-2br]|uniref:DUF2000 family protein n=1 Tax=Rhodoferax sp. U11-2br TaxID=2838878 RepID=UPI001BE72936|nr:DUF2000 family protein [Rhodoferax sp. U11-2br]MBT3066615.1 DUF2000 family protein [Rhodoferax sp. U11-2br]
MRRYPFIILDAKNSNQLQTLVADVIEKSSVSCNVFTTSMIGTSAETQIKETLEAVGEGLNFVVVVIFGSRADVEPLTKKFSLSKE